ncbi:Uncharacterised protein [Paenibacillus thiaminolyticus]|nr:Uncharacterised protein [Paenibacillus thiaminolyticus]
MTTREGMVLSEWENGEKNSEGLRKGRELTKLLRGAALFCKT